jgi:hypothetical protein
MVVLRVELHQLRLEVGADTVDDYLQVVQDGFGEHFAAIPGQEDQIGVRQKYTVRALLNVVAAARRPKYHSSHDSAPSL